MQENLDSGLAPDHLAEYSNLSFAKKIVLNNYLLRMHEAKKHRCTVNECDDERISSRITNESK